MRTQGRSDVAMNTPVERGQDDLRLVFLKKISRARIHSRKVRCLMYEYDLQPKRRRRFVATTDSDHDCPIFQDLSRHRIIDGPNQLWVADITYIAIATGFRLHLSHYWVRNTLP